MEEDSKRLSVSGHDDEVGDTTVEGLGGLVGSLLQLLVVVGRLNKLEDVVGELSISEGEGFGIGGLFESKK